MNMWFRYQWIMMVLRWYAFLMFVHDTPHAIKQGVLEIVDHISYIVTLIDYAKVPQYNGRAGQKFSLGDGYVVYVMAFSLIISTLHWLLNRDGSFYTFFAQIMLVQLALSLGSMIISARFWNIRLLLPLWLVAVVITVFF